MKTTNDKNQDNFTQVQRAFYVGKLEIKKLECCSGTDSAIEQIKYDLWKKLQNFALSTAHHMLQERFLPSDAWDDISQACALVFFENFDKYDPSQSTPTTFFVRYFKQAICEYRAFSQNISKYTFKNSLKIQNACDQIERSGIPASIDQIAAQTNLSQKVIKNTLLYGDCSVLSSLDDEQYSQIPCSTTLTPEEILIQKMNSDAWKAALSKINSDKDVKIFLNKIGIDHNHRTGRSFETTAERCGTTVKEARAIYKRVVRQLQKDVNLRHNFII